MEREKTKRCLFISLDKFFSSKSSNQGRILGRVRRLFVRIERLKERRRALRELRGVLGPASRELLDRFMLEPEAQ